jgi:pyruvate dehydrogenase E2 component (dihydrolipoamide acetyltransferase)
MPDITMPQLGETVTEGTITRWFKKVGEQVAMDEPLFEVSTDKVDSEVPASSTGYIAEILVEEGQTVDVGTKIAVISDDKPAEGGDDTSGGEKAEQPQKAEAEEPESGATDEPRPEDEQPPEDSDIRPPRAEEEADKADGGGGQARAQAPAPTPRGAQRKSEAAEPTPGTEGNGPAGPTAGRLLSPVVRRLINEHGLDPDSITGTGQDGRITRADVLSYIDKNGGKGKAEEKPAAKEAAPPAQKPAQKPAEKPAPAGAPARATAMAPPKPGKEDEVIPFSNIRRRTAEHMVRSKATSAHVLVAAEVDYSGVEKVRKAHRESFKAKEGFSLTYLPFIARAVIDALDDFPHVNASVGENELILHRRINLAIAVDMNFEGLIVPVVHDADQLRLPALARSMADLARRARSRELNADDISGGTFTITNPGPFGTFLTFPVINQPQVAILSTDGIRKRPVAVELPDGSDAVVVHPVGMLGLAFDHRAFDGAYASAFLAKLKEILETRDWSQEI